VAFPVADDAKLAAAFGLASLAKPAAIVIWTTTPWTIPANQALNVHPEFNTPWSTPASACWCWLKSWSSRASSVTTWKARSSPPPGSALELINFRHPFYDRLSPVYLADYVELGAGTGVVHSAPAYGVDDFVTCKRYGMVNDDILTPVQSNGVYVESLPFFGGQFIWKANPAIVDKLSEVGALMHTETISHSYMHCWRHKTPLIYRATAQWFVGMDKQPTTASPARARAQGHRRHQVRPGLGPGAPALDDRQPPGLVHLASAQLGRADPVLPDKETGELHPRTVELMEEVAKRVEQEGIEAWFKLDAAELLGDEAGQYDKISDTLDVWFDSGTTHWHVLRGSHDIGHATGPRADLYLEGSDQHRGWFHSSLLTGCAIDNHAPYRELLTHGFTVDENGRKMSKSLGNTIEPQKVNDTLGADILRLWVSATDYSGEMAVSEQILQRSADAYRRIRNTARFLLSNLTGFNPATDLLPAEDMLALDRWAVDRTLLLQRELQEHYGEYRFWNVYSKIHNFCVQELGGFYLDIIKDRQYTTGANSVARRSCQTALFHISEALVRWIAPILAFTADEIWQYLPGERNESVMLNGWYQGLSDCRKAELDRAYWDRVMAVKASVNKELENQRTAKVIGGNLQAEVTLFAERPERRPGQAGRRTALRADHLGRQRGAVRPGAGRSRGHRSRRPQAEDGQVRPRQCGRCWHFRADVGSHPEHPEICSRCVDNLSGAGEVRHYA
jgi:isoleucyl-tRNA synthetase